MEKPKLCTNCKHCIEPNEITGVKEHMCNTQRSYKDYVSGHYAYTIRCADKNSEGKCPDYEKSIGCLIASVIAFIVIAGIVIYWNFN